jgi:uncharacterized protein (TIGR03118 family)
MVPANRSRSAARSSSPSPRGQGRPGPAFFIFATANGTISAWSPAISFTNAVTVVDNSAFADYEGLALANNGSGNFLYGTDFATGNIDVFNSQFQPTTLAGSFTDPNLPSGFTPYGIHSLDGNLYVSYVPKNFTPGGLIDVFDTNGNFRQRLVTGGNLDFPWGMAIAPHNFGKFSNALLVGNVFDGHINVYNPITGASRGQLDDTNGNPFTEAGLWSLNFGNDGLAGSSDTLFFSAGINGYADGLFGSLVPSKKDKHGDTAGFGQNPNSGVSGDILGMLSTRGMDASSQVIASPLKGRSSGASPLAVMFPGEHNIPVQRQAESSGFVRTAHQAAVDLAFADFTSSWSDL